MKRILLAILALAQVAFVAARPVYNIKDFGAKGNGKTSNTEAINKAIAACSEAGGGVVLVPKGDYLTGTIVMRDNVELNLAEGAQLTATTNLAEYKSYICDHDGFQHYKMAYMAYWNKAIVLAIKCQNVAITGNGTICGRHIEDPEGEERIRGPHAVVFAETKNFVIRGVKITQAGNYNFMGYHLENGSFENLVISEGYDGIHIRGGKNIVIRNCDIQTGDDAIAGGWWENTVISNCFINSTCNGIRLIYPATDFEIGHCQFKGPGTYPQRSVKSLRNKKQMKAAIILQPGAWQDCEGLLDKVYIHDVEIADVENALTTDLKRGNWCGEVIIERMKATGINKSAFQLQSYFGGIHEDVVVRDIDIQYVGRTDDKIRNSSVNPTRTESQYLPYWGMYFKGIRNLTLQNIKLSYTGEDCRSAIGVEDVFKIAMDGVEAQDVPGKEKIVSINSALSPTRKTNKFIPHTDPYAKKK